MHDMSHHADLESAKVQMRQLLRHDSRELRQEIIRKGEEELVGRLIVFVLAVAATAFILLQGPA